MDWMNLRNEILKILPDSFYLKLRYRSRFGKKLNLKNPRTFNEKLQWLKLYNRNPEYTKMVDKYAVKQLVADRIGKQYVIPTLGTWDRFDDIDFSKLPDRFVLKCTHDSGGVVICKDKLSFDRKQARAIINKSMRRNFYWIGREWPYKKVPSKIIAEEYIEGDSGSELKDYKMMCFDGCVKCTLVCENRFSDSGLKMTFYDTDWKIMPFGREYPRSRNPLDRPVSYNEMATLAEKLSENIPFVRVDFYEIDGKIYFGELTFYPASGLKKFYPSEWDLILGKWIKLPERYVH